MRTQASHEVLQAELLHVDARHDVLDLGCQRIVARVLRCLLRLLLCLGLGLLLRRKTPPNTVNLDGGLQGKGGNFFKPEHASCVTGNTMHLPGLQVSCVHDKYLLHTMRFDNW